MAGGVTEGDELFNEMHIKLTELRSMAGKIRNEYIKYGDESNKPEITHEQSIELDKKFFKRITKKEKKFSDLIVSMCKFFNTEVLNENLYIKL